MLIFCIGRNCLLQFTTTLNSDIRSSSFLYTSLVLNTSTKLITRVYFTIDVDCIIKDILGDNED